MSAARSFAFAALLALSACATVGESGPSLRYADAASRGAWATLLAGRPSESQVEATTENWSHALSDSFACRVPARQVVEAAVVGALEIGAMNAAASGGSEREVRQGAAHYAFSVAQMLLRDRERPTETRCQAMAAWAPRVAAEGREAVARARRKGYMEGDYGLLLGALAQ
jgi:hypothetical protein